MDTMHPDMQEALRKQSANEQELARQQADIEYQQRREQARQDRALDRQIRAGGRDYAF